MLEEIILDEFEWDFGHYFKLYLVNDILYYEAGSKMEIPFIWKSYISNISSIRFKNPDFDLLEFEIVVNRGKNLLIRESDRYPLPDSGKLEEIVTRIISNSRLNLKSKSSNEQSNEMLYEF